jgi:signal transduction histidine kinase
MLPASSHPAKSRVLRVAQLLLVMASCAMAMGFVRHQLSASSVFYAREFEQQIHGELGRGDTEALARKLSAFANSSQFDCVLAKKGGAAFFEKKSGDCYETFFRARGEIADINSGIAIEFYLRPQSEVLWGLAVFFLVQALLGALISLSRRQARVLERRFENELAAFARQVAHDIRSPLAALEVEEGIVESQERLKQDAVGRLNNLVTTLLGEPTKEARENLGEWLGPLVEEKQIELKDSNVTIGALWSTDLKSVVLPGDPYMWRRVLSNLLNNAVEACKPGSGSVSIEVERCAEGFSVGISDNGAGIPADVMAQIGQRGFTYGKEGGLGLGVFGAKEFVESLGGQIQIVSRTGGGTKVRLVVPPVAQTVVLIEDDTKLADLWKLSGEKRGIEVRHFAAPEAFLQEKSAFGFQVPIYLDLNFPGTALDPAGFGKSLREEGFSEIFLCAGKDQRELAKYRWAKGICGKEPPWL